MIIRLMLSVLVTCIVGLATVRAWQSMTQFNEDQIAHIAETESYAARSQLITNVEKVLSALQGMHVYWTTSATEPYQEWKVDTAMDPATLNCARTILWDDPAHATRFARSLEHPDGRFRPDESQWEAYESLLARAHAAKRDTMKGPLQGPGGRPVFEVYLVDESAPQAGRLAAVIDARECLEALLHDESPGYAIRVSWNDTPLYERGQPAPGIPASWVRTGYVRTSLGAVWKVIHAPTRELVGDFESRAVDLLLVLGLVIAVLMGTLTFENWRAYTRAAAAERAERRLAALNRNLEREIQKRTRDLANRTADLQTVTDSVAHDMRNPLSTIAMNVQLFERRYGDRLEPDALALLNRIQPAIDQVAKILDRMLGLAAVHHATFGRERLDMKSLVQEVYDGLAATEPGAPAKLEVGDLPEVDADRKLVSMLLTNLIGNALKYTRTKPDAVIRVGHEARDGPTVYCVADNGIGFDQDAADRMFTAFERLDGDTATEGVGLGLSIVARVIERHGGWIRAEGVPAEGAIFRFTLEPGTDADA